MVHHRGEPRTHDEVEATGNNRYATLLMDVRQENDVMNHQVRLHTARATGRTRNAYILLYIQIRLTGQSSCTYVHKCVCKYM